MVIFNSELREDQNETMQIIQTKIDNNIASNDLALEEINGDLNQLHVTMKYNNQLNQQNVHQLREEQNGAFQIYETNIEQMQTNIGNYIASNDMALKAINDILRYDVEKMQLVVGTTITAGGITIFDTGSPYENYERKGYFFYSKTYFRIRFYPFQVLDQNILLVMIQQQQFISSLIALQPNVLTITSTLVHIRHLIIGPTLDHRTIHWTILKRFIRRRF